MALDAFEFALKTATTIDDVERALSHLSEPLKLDFVSLMHYQGEAKRIASQFRTTPEALFAKVNAQRPIIAAIAERFNVTQHPPLIRALCVVLEQA